MATHTLDRPATSAVDGTGYTAHPPVFMVVVMALMRRTMPRGGTCTCSCSTCDNDIGYGRHCGRAYNGCNA